MAAVRHLGFVVCVRTANEGHLVVITDVQNLVGIDAVILIICMFFDFTSLASKCLSTPPSGLFGGFYPLIGEQCQRNPKKAHPCVSPRRLSHRARKSADASDL